MIELKEVSKAYNKKNVFEDVNLKLEEGKVTAIVGHNGCGKSTLLKVISGLVTRDSGEIIYERNYRFAYVPEKFPAISMSARAYLEYMSRIDGRLHRYFYSSRPILPMIMTACFLGVTYSMKPINIASGFVISGIFQFALMTFVALNVNGCEEAVEEQILLFHGEGWERYLISREVSLLVISGTYGLILTLGPVVINYVNRCSMFSRPLTAGDVSLGGCIIFGSGLAGCTIGDLFHPRIVAERNLAILGTVGMFALSITQDALIDTYGFLVPIRVFLPSVMKPARNLGNGDNFEALSVLTFLVLMVVYFWVAGFVKNLMLKKRKFS